MDKEFLSDHITFEGFKERLGIPHSNSKNDSEILGIIFDANTEVTKVLTPYADDIPIPPGRFHMYATELAASWAFAAWYRHMGQFDRAAAEQEIYEDKKKSFFDVLKAARTSKTRSVLVTDDPKADRLLLPSQRDSFILD